MKTIITYLLAFFFIAAPFAQAAESERSRLKGVIAAALDVIYGESSSELTMEEKQAKVRAVIEENYDLDVIIRRAIGRNWNLMKPAEQDRVLELVKQLVVKAYVNGMEGKSRPEVELGDVVKITDKRIEIPSTVKVDDQTNNVLYRLGKMRNGWQIYDIVAEDMSVVSNYRDQIDDHFRKGTGAELITKLEELLTKEDLNEDIKL